MDSDEEEHERSINAVTTDNKKRRHLYYSDKSDQLKSMEYQIKILDDNMQLLQSKLNRLLRQGHIAKDCTMLRRQKSRTQNRTGNCDSPAQTRQQPFNDNRSDQQV